MDCNGDGDATVVIVGHRLSSVVTVIVCRRLRLAVAGAELMVSVIIDLMLLRRLCRECLLPIADILVIAAQTRCVEQVWLVFVMRRAAAMGFERLWHWLSSLCGDGLCRQRAAAIAMGNVMIKIYTMVVAGMAVIVKFLEGERCAVVSQAKF